MITKEQAVENVKKYVKSRNRAYYEIVSDRVNYIYKEDIAYGKYDGQKRAVFVVTCLLEGYTEPIPHFVEVDALTGEVLYTMTSHGYVEDRED